MNLGLTIKNSVFYATILDDDRDFVWQDSHSLDYDKISNLLKICVSLVANAAKAHPNLSQSITVSA